jgi:hypothetical protein
MKYALLLALLLAQDKRAYVAGRYALILDGTACAWIESFEGGNATAGVISEQGNLPKKHLGQVQYEPIKLAFQYPLPKPVQDWINDALSAKGTRKNGAIVSCDFQMKSKEMLEFNQGLIESVTFPTLDASSKELQPVIVTILPEFTRKGSPPANLNFPANSKAVVPAFTVAIDGLECRRVNRVDSLTIKVTVNQQNVGEARDYAKTPGRVEISNLALELAETDSAGWKTWHDDFVVKGNCDDSKEKSGTIELSHLNSKSTLCRLKFSGLGIRRLAPAPVNTAESARKIAAEMYCERLELEGASPTEPAKQQEPAPPAAGDAKDEGDRDPKDVPRYENCVRKSFEAYRERLYNEERAAYVTKDDPKKVEEFIEKRMTDAGWELDTRSETGDIRKGTNHTVVYYKKAVVHNAILTIGPTKDGETAFNWIIRDETRMHKELPQK